MDINRRDFLKLVGGAAAGMVTKKAVDTFIGAGGDKSSVERAYRSGETINNPYVGVKVDGWRLHFPLADLRDYQASHPDSEIQFELLTASSNIKAVGTGEFGDFGSSDARTSDGNNSYLDNEQGATHLTLLMDPVKDGGRFLRFQERNKQTGEITTEVFYPVIMENNFKSSDGVVKRRLTLEGEIPEDKLTGLVDRYKLMVDVFGLNADVAINRTMVKGNGPRQAQYDGDTGFILINDAYFLVQEVPNEGERVFVHECGHNLLDNARRGVWANDVKCAESILGILKVFNEFHDYLGPSLTKDQAESESLFNIFDESHYTGLENRGGHPYDDFNELFASTATTLHFYPDVFVDNFNTLSESDKVMVKKVVKCVRNFLEIQAGQDDLPKFVDFSDIYSRCGIE